jgi:hypothetical protein
MQVQKKKTRRYEENRKNRILTEKYMLGNILKIQKKLSGWNFTVDKTGSESLLNCSI